MQDEYTVKSNGHYSPLLTHMMNKRSDSKPNPSREWRGLTEDEIEAVLPHADGTAEMNCVPVEVSPGFWGTEFEEVDAWSKPLVMQVVRAIEAMLKERNT
jgi:hypothetical protein